VGAHALLTAAHCVPPDSGVVVSGLDAGVNVRAVSIHPLYEPLTGGSDVAVLWVEPALSLTPLPLATEPPEVSALVSVSGWGLTETGRPEGLRQAANHIATLQVADFSLETGPTGNACPGDSGGAVTDAHRRLIGLISSGAACGSGTTHHLRVDVYAAWIATQLGLAQPVDVEPPSVEWGRLRAGATLPSSLRFTPGFNDDRGVVRLLLQIDEGAAQSVNLAEPTVELTTAPGPHSVRLTATDAVLQVTSQTLQVVTQTPFTEPRTDGAACLDETDCNSLRCNQGRCAPSSCSCGSAPLAFVVSTSLLLRRRRLIGPRALSKRGGVDHGQGRVGTNQ
jgi:hypothetical protein